MKNNVYVITYAPCCVRDAQIWQKDPTNIDPMSDNWVGLMDSDSEIYVGICTAGSEEDAIRMVADIEQCHPECLKARYIDPIRPQGKNLWRR